MDIILIFSFTFFVYLKLSICQYCFRCRTFFISYFLRASQSPALPDVIMSHIILYRVDSDQNVQVLHSLVSECVVRHGYILACSLLFLSNCLQWCYYCLRNHPTSWAFLRCCVEDTLLHDSDCVWLCYFYNNAHYRLIQ